jgi:hypothetical protein
MWQMLPIVRALGGLEHAFNVYKLTHRKISFILPLQHFFKWSAFWFGFIKSHEEGYGHEMKRHPNINTYANDASCVLSYVSSRH